jgi:ssDNA-binding Zn-finger/Zn-ribbon topoisomerase 1
MPVFGDDDDDFFLFDVIHPTASHEAYCPLCNKRLTIKNTKSNTQFLGCDYPTCQFSCDINAGLIYGLTPQEHTVVQLGGVNPQVLRKREVVQRKVDNKHRRIQTGQTNYNPFAPKTGGVIFPDKRPTGEIDLLKKRVEELESTVKSLQEWIQTEKERREKFSIDL